MDIRTTEKEHVFIIFSHELAFSKSAGPSGKKIAHRQHNLPPVLNLDRPCRWTHTPPLARSSNYSYSTLRDARDQFTAAAAAAPAGPPERAVGAGCRNARKPVRCCALLTTEVHRVRDWGAHRRPVLSTVAAVLPLIAILKLLPRFLANLCAKR